MRSTTFKRSGKFFKQERSLIARTLSYHGWRSAPAGLCWLGLFCLGCIACGVLVAVKAIAGQFLEAGCLVLIGLGMLLAIGAFMRMVGRRLAVLGAERERFQVLFERSSEAHLLFDATGIIDCNEMALRMLGYANKAELLRLHPARLSPEFQPDGRLSIEKCLEMDEVTRKQGTHRFEWTHRKQDGADFPVEVDLTCVELNGTEAFVVVWHDLTERREAETALQQSHARMTLLFEELCYSEARFHAFLDQGPLFTWITDATGRIVYLNEPYCLMIGRRLEECVGKTVFDIYPADVAQPLLENIELVVRTGRPLTAEETVPLPDGKLHVFLVHKFPLRDPQGHLLVGGSAIDITERKAIEEAVQQSRENLKHAQAMAHVGSWERDYLTGTISWSDEMYRLCGLEPGAILPSIEALTTFTHPLDRKRARDCMVQAMSLGKGAEVEVRLVGADGILRYVSIRNEILDNEAGAPVGARGTMTDVTERVKALQQQTKFVHLIENSSDFIAMATLDGMLLSMNPAGRKLVGLERAEEVSTTMLQDFIPAEAWDGIRRDVLPVVMSDDRWEGDSQLVDVVTGKVHDMQASFFLIRNPISGEPMCLATVQRDITTQKWLDTQLQQILVLVQDQNVELELHRQELAVANTGLEAANARLEALATTDGLTGAKNHRAFQERLTEEYRRANRTCRIFSLILLDVDRFKLYNDQFGHPEGDRVLKQIVQVLQATARTTDLVARYGGEEFVILLPETGIEGAMEAAERFRKAIEGANWPHSPMTASFGVASLMPLTQTGQQLVEMADRALYASKANGRNRVTHASHLLESVA